jgi:hypothetical protein
MALTILADGNTISQVTAGRARWVTPKVKEEQMRVYQIVPIIVIALALPASAQQSDRSLRHQIESVVSSHAETFNKQNASGIVGLYPKDGVRR